MVRMLEGLAAHCVTQWQRRLSRPLHAAPMADFLGGFFPPAPGKAPLRPYQRAQRRPRYPPALPAEQSASSGAAQPAAAQGVLSSRHGLGKGRGSTGGLCPMHGAPSCERCRGLQTAAGADTQATPGQHDRPQAGDRTSCGQAGGGCRRWSGSPRPEACMAGCGGRVSNRTRTRTTQRTGPRRQPLCRRHRSKAPGRNRVRAESERRRGTPRTGPSANRSATRHPSTQKGAHGHKISPPTYRTPCSLSRGRGADSPHPLPPLITRSRRARPRSPPPTPPHSPPATHRQRVGRPQRHRSRLQNRNAHPREGAEAREGSQWAAPQGRGEGRGISTNPRHTAAPRPRASDWCKPGHQGSPPQASPRGDGGLWGLAQRVKRPRLDAIAQPRRAAFSLWASPDRQQ